jgi:hypothetical protein
MIMMKKIFTALLVYCYLSPFAYGDLLNEKQEVLPKVVEVFSYFQNIFKPSSHYSQATVTEIFTTKQATLSELNAIAQENFLRPPSSERLDEVAIKHYHALCARLSEDGQQHIIDLFAQIGDIGAIYPKRPDPAYILVYGATVPNMRDRVMFLAKLFETGALNPVTETEIIFLVGERALFASETPQVLRDPSPHPVRSGWQPPAELPHDEREAAALVWEQLDLPAVVREKPFRIIKSAKKPGAKRAQTEDTVQAWLDTMPDLQAGHCLIISSNPFVYYQQKVTELALKKLGQTSHFSCEAVGDKAPVLPSKAVMIGILLDNLARTLYVEHQLHNASF